ncbi:MAG TPA: DnaB-like helicase C-terminal domain-containing protein [Egibacteraceae bacterium]|nr:DnaB-like helicase C-terminal domain-containing protein [Egibacteraceae bacterium]
MDEVIELAGARAAPLRGPRTVAQLLTELDAAANAGARPDSKVMGTGFDPLDQVMEGGIRQHDLVLVAGAPGIGKTVAALQWARSIALSGHRVIYACYEHEEPVLIARLLAQELRTTPVDKDPDLVRNGLRDIAESRRSLSELAAATPAFAAGSRSLSAYAERLWLVRASGGRTGLKELEQIAVEHRNGPMVLFIDYLQKVAIQPEQADEGEKVLRITEGLKELALSNDVAVVAVAAADRTGLEARRLRLHHLRGSSALAYESDVVIMLNDKARAVSKVHLAYDPVRAETYKHYVVFTIEKNRSGQAGIDMEFRKDFAHYRFDPRGGYVAERLVDERLFEE